MLWRYAQYLCGKRIQRLQGVLKNCDSVPKNCAPSPTLITVGVLARYYLELPQGFLISGMLRIPPHTEKEILKGQAIRPTLQILFGENKNPVAPQLPAQRTFSQDIGHRSFPYLDDNALRIRTAEPPAPARSWPPRNFLEGQEGFQCIHCSTHLHTSSIFFVPISPSDQTFITAAPLWA